MNSSSTHKNKKLYPHVNVSKLLNSSRYRIDEETELSIINKTTLSIPMASSLGSFFEVIDADPDCNFFRPHALSRQFALELKNLINNDVYLVAVDRNANIRGYCFLRGWDEGWEIPSLGICLHPDGRGKGLSKLLMTTLHGIAKIKNCEKVRLTVDKKNKPAISLYKNLGYNLAHLDNHRFIGFKYL